MTSGKRNSTQIKLKKEISFKKTGFQDEPISLKKFPYQLGS